MTNYLSVIGIAPEDPVSAQVATGTDGTLGTRVGVDLSEPASEIFAFMYNRKGHTNWEIIIRQKSSADVYTEGGCTLLSPTNKVGQGSYIMYKCLPNSIDISRVVFTSPQIVNPLSVSQIAIFADPAGSTQVVIDPCLSTVLDPLVFQSNFQVVYNVGNHNYAIPFPTDSAAG